MAGDEQIVHGCKPRLEDDTLVYSNYHDRGPLLLWGRAGSPVAFRIKFCPYCGEDLDAFAINTPHVREVRDFSKRKQNLDDLIPKRTDGKKSNLRRGGPPTKHAISFKELARQMRADAKADPALAKMLDALSPAHRKMLGLRVRRKARSSRKHKRPVTKR